ncbi:hypothetical protein Goklo_004413 [Gossypium klotzschianum]|uniref:Uncharacterized protein n=1 Tax=Gossypium klotzschianum TaxID=34286 RepID=A0A7J8VP79_9ROSI|nr:hypothetical protein [Gossypium klotzschianum]
MLPAAIFAYAIWFYLLAKRLSGLRAAFHDLLGQGILTSDGESWLIQRKTAALEFTTRTLRQATGCWGNKTNKNRLWCILDKASNEKKAMDLQDLGYPKGVTASEDEV